MSIFLLILGLVMFVSLVVIHELGHFIAARKSGVVVEEFGIGFPPIAWSKKLKDGLLFTINWLPLGGFVKLKGENDSATSRGSFGAASLKNKVIIMTAGVAMNLVAAFILFTFLALIGLPKLIENQYTVKSDTKVTNNQILVGLVTEGSPAEKSGIKQRDRILSIGDKSKTVTIDSAEQLPKVTKEFQGKNVEVVIKREGEVKAINLELRSDKDVNASIKSGNPKGYLGVSPAEFTLRKSTWSAPIVSLGLIRQFTIETLKGIGGALLNVVKGNGSEASKQVSGPVGIFVILKDGSLLGFQFTLMIIAIISLTLAIMNVLPIPALDGGRLFVTLLYHKVLRKPLKQSTEEKIHGTGFAILMLLFVLITVVDVKRFW